MTTSFTKEDGPATIDGAKHVRVGVSWDTSAGMSGGWVGKIKKKMGTDLDLVAILMQGGAPVRYCGIGNNDPLGNGSVLHSGDNRTGKGDGDDETIDVDIARVPMNITSIVFSIVAFKPMSSFDKAENVTFTVYASDGSGFEPIAVTMPSLLGSRNAHKVLRLTGRQLEVVDEQVNVIQGDRDSLLRFSMR